MAIALDNVTKPESVNKAQTWQVIEVSKGTGLKIKIIKLPHSKPYYTGHAF